MLCCISAIGRLALDISISVGTHIAHIAQPLVWIRKLLTGCRMLNPWITYFTWMTAVTKIKWLSTYLREWVCLSKCCFCRNMVYTHTENARPAYFNAPIIPFFQPFDRQALSVGGSCWKGGLSLWRRFPRQRERVKHSVTVVYGDTESHGHNHTPSASGMCPCKIGGKTLSNSPGVVCESSLPCLLSLGQCWGSPRSWAQTQKRTDVPPDFPHIDQGNQFSQEAFILFSLVKTYTSLVVSPYNCLLLPIPPAPLRERWRCQCV